jgi:quercetin dioxygenase-like cupin family protein
MKSRWTWTALIALLGVAMCVGKVLATPASGFAGTTTATARFGEIDSHVQNLPADWQAKLKTKGISDLYVQSNVWQAGGTTGWHTHPGPSLVIVTVGTVTVYDGDDPSCTPHVYSANGASSFVDVGGGVVHLIRNETSSEARTVAVQLVPAAATRRIDAPDPGYCSF